MVRGWQRVGTTETREGSGGRQLTGRRLNWSLQGSAGGGESQGGALSKSTMADAQATARTMLHVGIDRGRNHGGDCPDATRATAGCDDTGVRTHHVAEGLR